MVRARSCLVMTEIVPGVAVLAIVFADGAPLAFTQIGSPLFPSYLLVAFSFQTQSFCGLAHDCSPPKMFSNGSSVSNRNTWKPQGGMSRYRPREVSSSPLRS